MVAVDWSDYAEKAFDCEYTHLQIYTISFSPTAINVKINVPSHDCNDTIHPSTCIYLSIYLPTYMSACPLFIDVSIFILVCIDNKQTDTISILPVSIQLSGCSSLIFIRCISQMQNNK